MTSKWSVQDTKKVQSIICKKLKDGETPTAADIKVAFPNIEKSHCAAKLRNELKVIKAEEQLKTMNQEKG